MQYKFEDIAFNSTAKKKPVSADKDTYLGLDHLDSGSLIVKRFGSEVAPKSEKLIMQKGDVLFGKRRAYQKKVAIAPFDGIFSAHGMVLRPKEQVVYKDFFPLFISSDYFLDSAIKISVGSLSPTINWNTLKELIFELPTLEKQRNIADVLWVAIKTQNAYKNLFFQTEKLVQSRFVEMFGDPVRNDKNWHKVQISDFCIVKSGTTISLDKENEGGNILYVKVADMNMQGNEKFLSSSSRSVSEETAENGIFCGNTIVFPKNGAAVATNKKRIIIMPTCIDLNIMGVSPDETVNIEFFYQWFQFIDLSDLSNVSAIPSINAKTISELTVILPPLSLQNRFADFVRQADKSKFELQRLTKEIVLWYKKM
ncbi:MAG: restriction endonuclease subunit S [Deferribacteraceae bacterium]|jgi:type I restriction enzyme S subunit|nr:restriction endonuclease subunit S [Deferribacteraceae bacterium]